MLDTETLPPESVMEPANKGSVELSLGEDTGTQRTTRSAAKKGARKASLGERGTGSSWGGEDQGDCAAQKRPSRSRIGEGGARPSGRLQGVRGAKRAEAASENGVEQNVDKGSARGVGRSDVEPKRRNIASMLLDREIASSSAIHCPLDRD